MSTTTTTTTTPPPTLAADDVYLAHSTAAARGWPANLPRIVPYHISGNRTVSVFCIPGRDDVPRYVYRHGAFVLLEQPQ